MQYLNFPFTAILGQDAMKRALLLNIIDPKIGGVLLTGQQGTGKSTAVRSLVDLLPEIEVVDGCRFACNPDSDPEKLCNECQQRLADGPLPRESRKMRIIDLPLGATEDMVTGSLDIEKVLKEGMKSLHVGLLAKANRGILYVDEVNLLQDHLVDLLLDSAASGLNIIEREGVSLVHPASFILVGSMNPEEGELRPQISDRFGLEVGIVAPKDPVIRAEITKAVIAFQADPKGFIERASGAMDDLRASVTRAREAVSSIAVPDYIYQMVSQIVVDLGIHSQRADITFIRCSRANAAFERRDAVNEDDLEMAIDLVFRHRLRAFDESILPEQIETRIHEIFDRIKRVFTVPADDSSETTAESSETE
ncbi:MAG TPA: ATP-binding protein [Candidatus Lokiarchaeia archaeon]|nr:ATP-binding protein [Candidatus Lokiarchaeia archaeon]